MKTITFKQYQTERGIKTMSREYLERYAWTLQALLRDARSRIYESNITTTNKR